MLRSMVKKLRNSRNKDFKDGPMATLIKRNDRFCVVDDRKKGGEIDTLIVMLDLTAYLLLQIMPKVFM